MRDAATTHQAAVCKFSNYFSEITLVQVTNVIIVRNGGRAYCNLLLLFQHNINLVEMYIRLYI
jgi:hypothetical protein